MSLSAMPVNPFVLNLAHSQEFMDSIALNLSQNKEFVCSLAQNKDFVCSLSQNKDFINSLTQNKDFISDIQRLNIELLEDEEDSEEYRNSLQNYIDYSITTSDLQVPRRLSAAEFELGTDMYASDDGRKPIREEITLIKEKLDTISKPLRTHIEGTVSNICISPQTTLDFKACELVEFLNSEVKPRNAGEIYLESREIIPVLKNKIAAEYQIKDIKNPRQAKKDIIERAKALFPKNFVIDKKPKGKGKGNGGLRVVWKPSGYIRPILN
jgi:hypothetical protein